MGGVKGREMQPAAAAGHITHGVGIDRGLAVDARL